MRVSTAFDTWPFQAATTGKTVNAPRAVTLALTAYAVGALLFLDQIKREKGVWWMPWQQEAMKDVIPCVKPWGAGNRL